MSILGSTNYSIHATFYGASGVSEETYVDNFDNLRRTIAISWSKIPHMVKVTDKVVYVYKDDEQGATLAKFTFKHSNTQKLPDHF